MVAVKYLPKSEDAKEQKKDKTTTKKSLKDTNNKKLKTFQDLTNLNQTFNNLLNHRNQFQEKKVFYDSYHYQLQQQLKNQHLNAQEINDLFY